MPLSPTAIPGEDTGLSASMFMPLLPGELFAPAEAPERSHAPDKPIAESMTVATAMLRQMRNEDKI